MGLSIENGHNHALVEAIEQKWPMNQSQQRTVRISDARTLTRG